MLIFYIANQFNNANKKVDLIIFGEKSPKEINWGKTLLNKNFNTNFIV